MADPGSNPVVWECPVCGNQTVGSADGYEGKPFICDGYYRPHPVAEREQKLPEAFEAHRQHIGLEPL